MADHIRVFLETREPTAELIGLLRRHTGKGVNDLRQAIVTQQPILDEKPHHNEYTEFCTRTTELLDELEARGIRYAVELDGVGESPQDLRNEFQRWRNLGVQIEWADVLKSGEPIDIDTLEWLKQNASRDVFRIEFKGIVRGDRYYRCDEGTAAWARRERDLTLKALWTTATESGGQVDIDMLEWLRESASGEVFRATLEQIVREHRYTCDEATVAWARRELE